MPISNYQELKDEIIGWSNRRDQDLNIDTFIMLAEQEMYNNPVKSLRLRDIELRATADTATDSQFLALPDGYQKMRSVRINVTDEYDVLTYIAPEVMVRRNGVGKPCYYTITNQIEFDIIPEEVYSIEMNYYGKSSGITSANTSNSVLTSNPEIYLYGSLYKLFTRATDFEQAANYKNLFYEAIAGANKSAKSGRYGSTARIQVDGDTP